MKKIILLLSVFHSCCLIGMEDLGSASSKFNHKNSKYKVGIVSEMVYNFCPDIDKNNLKYQRFFRGISLESKVNKNVNLRAWLGTSHFKILDQLKNEDYLGKFDTRSDLAFAIGADWNILAQDNYCIRFSPNFYWGCSSVKNSVENEKGQLKVQVLDKDGLKLYERKLSGDISLIFTKYFLKPSVGVRLANHTLDMSGEDVEEDGDAHSRVPRSVGLRWGFDIPYSKKLLFKIEGGLIN